MEGSSNNKSVCVSLVRRRSTTEGPCLALPPLATAFHHARSQSKHTPELSSTPPSLGFCPHFARHSKPEQPFAFVLVETFHSERARHRREGLAIPVVAILLFWESAPDKHGFLIMSAVVVFCNGSSSLLCCLLKHKEGNFITPALVVGMQSWRVSAKSACGSSGKIAWSEHLVAWLKENFTRYMDMRTSETIV